MQNKRSKVSKAPVMAWMLVNPQIHNIFASLGVQHGDAYKVSKDCLAILGDILSKLSVEDRTLRTFRRAIGFGQHIRKDLLPLLIHVKDDTKTTDATKIIDATIKILVNLTIPVECLLSMEALSKTDMGRHTIFEINKLLYTSKEAFVDSRSVKAVMDHMKFVIEKGTTLELDECDSINNCLLLLRNILHIPENRMQISNCPLAHRSMQNKILWNLFTQSIDKLLLHLMSFPQKIYWVVTMVQLIALMYKDQHIGTLQKLLNLWFEASLSESSDDNESNTSPPNQGSEDSSPMLTSDPTSDSSDNGGSGGNCNNRPSGNGGCKQSNNEHGTKQHVVRSLQNRNKVLLTSQKQRTFDGDSSTSSQTTDTKSGAISTSTSQSDGNSSNNNRHTKPETIQKQQSESSDYGYGTQVENQESISSSSNDDETPQQKPIHQKPHMVQKPRYNSNKTRTNITPLDKKELRRKKLIKRSKINIINMKGLMHHSPSDEDISNILKEFTVDFLLKGYGSLVQELYNQLLSNSQIQIDTSHFFWLVTYFLKFATQLELDFEHIEPVLSFNIISYLVYEGVNLCEQLEMNSSKTAVDLKPCLRRMHLVVTAIKEFLQAINIYDKISHLTAEDRASLRKLQIKIACTENLKCLFLLLIRQYNPNIQSKEYLQDLIITNHILLLFMDTAGKLPECEEKSNILSHVQQFASVEMMHQYGLLLENFEKNGKFINDCIFTMMHHIGGDVDNVSTLFQPIILKTFSKIWETGYGICDDWSDLIEYVIHKFINVPREPTKSGRNKSIFEGPSDNMFMSNITATAEKYEDWSEEDIDALYWYYVQSRKCENLVDNIKKLYEENGVLNKTENGIVQQLFQQNMISRTDYEEYMKTDLAPLGMVKENSQKENDQEYHDIQVLKEQLVKENKGNSILWLQKILLEACHCKIIIKNELLLKNDDDLFEAIPYCYLKLNQSIPIVPWSKEYNNILNHQSFILLLHKLGFHLPTDTRKLFVRIPTFWTANYMYSIAQKLGPVDSDTLKFDVDLLETDEKLELNDIEGQDTTLDLRLLNIEPFTDKEMPTTSLVHYTPLSNPSPNWLQTVLHSKVNAMIDLAQDISSTEALSIPITSISSLPSVSTTNSLNYDLESSSLLPDIEEVPLINIPEQSVMLIEDTEHNSISETESVTSDLTRMYVSDEEDKQ